MPKLKKEFSSAKPLTKTVAKKSTSKKKVASAKPKINIKKVSIANKKKHSKNKDSSVVDLKKNFSEIYHEADTLLDDEDVTEEALEQEDSNFDWGDLLEDDDEPKHGKKKTKDKKAKKKKSHGFSWFGMRKNKDHKDDQTKDKITQGKSSKEDDKLIGATFDSQIKTKKLDKHAKKVTKKMGKQALEDFSGDHVKKRIPMRIYRRLAVGFVILAIILISVIFYFSFVKAVITVKLTEEATNQSLIISVYDRGDDYVIPEQAVYGVVKEIELEQSKVYDVAGSEIIGEEVTGTMTLINNYSKSQPLVATTRLLSPDGKLFRLKNSVNVPAGKSITAEVYADQPDKDMVPGDETYIIPGLWEGLQDQIYAESKAGDLTYKKKLKKVISQEDVDAALEDLRDVLITKAQPDIEETYSEYKQKLYQINEDDVEYEINHEIGEEVDQFTITIKAKIVVVAFDDSPIYQMAQTELSDGLPANKELVGLNTEEFFYEITDIDMERQIAEIDVNFSGRIELKPDAEVIDKKMLINLSKTELEAYLSGLPSIESYQVKISPSFVNKAPSLVDRIKIEIQK